MLARTVAWIPVVWLACSGDPSETSPQPTPDTSNNDSGAQDSGIQDTGEPTALKAKVLMVMIDGFIPDVIPMTDTPAMDRLLLDSAWSMEARAESTTISGSGWSTFVTGVHWDKHQVPDNAFSNLRTFFRVFTLAFDDLNQYRILPIRFRFVNFFDHHGKMCISMNQK